ncbi:UDP-Gal or UDP-GlcNAc-dependent glycosyltransferase [Trypanosoma conorhini]|uniref:Hexosyltransferase n=1 Tax=Trypanosoma conorhini TaxID=83891 RepID=A0A422Q0A6_9TRYP|nr:UDP-Gal or UDP-GlcNAc-dependent glycosyltransferase [Trypanosoma conorhini]RNF23408.1 UDP-Gal or UDP-GlcNAc-dependent glycosyltransferase [Trypanosoma conorhini]
MLVLYVLGRNPVHGYNYSAALLEEAALWNDVVALPMNEGRVTTNKTIGGNGYWGSEAEIGLSRKTYFWLELALHMFPTVPYLAKGDDDMFLRVPQFLADLPTLPRRGLYWGLLLTSAAKVRYASGLCVTLARDVAQHVVSYARLRRAVLRPEDTADSEYEALIMLNEDVMMGRAIEWSRYAPVVYAREKVCSFHDATEGRFYRPTTANSVVVHHLRESDYGELMDRFGNDTAPAARVFRRGSRCHLHFPCRR